MMWIGAAFFTAMEHRYLQRVGEFGWKLWVDSKEAVCAGLIAGWALVGIGDGIIQAKLVYPDSTAEVVAMEAEKAAAGTPGTATPQKPATPPAPAANPH
jgi:hypothetical protein